MSPIKQLLPRLMFLIQKNTNVAIVFSLHCILHYCVYSFKVNTIYNNSEYEYHCYKLIHSDSMLNAQYAKVIGQIQHYQNVCCKGWLTVEAPL